ncbi:hypothetical protein PYCC9005_000003 [Savitreella phatthalungensis]
MLSLLALVTAAAAHFTLDSPYSRGFSEDSEPQAPCGGFNTVNSSRQSFPVSDGQYQINSRHAQASVAIYFSRDGTNFDSSSVETFQVTGLGTVCLSLPTLPYSAGDNVTMQVVYRASSESTNLYQCADLSLVSSAVTPSSCSNGTNVQVSGLRVGAAASAGTSASRSSASATASASSSRASTSASSTARSEGERAVQLGLLALAPAALLLLNI